MPDHLEHLPLPPPTHQPHRVVTGPRSLTLPARVPEQHAQALTAQLAFLDSEFERVAKTSRPANSRGYLVKAKITEGADAHVSGLGDKNTDTVVVDRTDDGVLLHNRSGSLKPLRAKVEQYADPEKTSDKTGLRKNTRLVAPLEGLQLATLADLSDGWLRPDALDEGERVWVQAWAAGGRLGEEEERERVLTAIKEFLKMNEIDSQDLSSFAVTEHDIYQVELSGAALMDLPEQLPDIYRLSPPQKVLVPWLIEHQPQIDVPDVGDPEGDVTTVGILDTGIAEEHPLLAPAMLAEGSSSVPGEPSAADGHGHGTGMAGVAAYPDLGRQIRDGGPLRPRCMLQNLRVTLAGEGAEPEDMLQRTQDAVLEAETVAAARRVFSISLGSRTARPGDSTPWSVAVDQLAYNDGDCRLFSVAAGNEPVDQLPAPGDYPAANLSAGLTSPGEAVNAITVGAITDLDAIDDDSGRTPVAGVGELSPGSRCDVGGSTRPIKPDVVAEGGNLSTDGTTCRADRAMRLLTASRQHVVGPWLTTTGQTSAATAQTAGVVAEIWEANPRRRPETVRGLLVHSARWTEAMRNQFSDKADRCRAFGYGVPNAEPASWSEHGRPTLILEEVIHPDRKIDNGREMHFLDLPMPDTALRELGDHVLELSVTLSYFVEPNETRSVRYYSAGLRWDLQRSFEDEEQFRKRINRLERDQDKEYEDTSHRIPWEVGPQARGRGTVQSDRARLAASELTGGRAIAVWPVAGWWHDRGRSEEAQMNYSLIVTIDAGEEAVDLYTPILNEVSIRTEVT